MAAFNLSEIHLDDVEFFCDIRLDNINVYSVVLVTNSVYFDEIVSDFCSRMKHYSCVHMIRHIHDDFARFTFVSHVNLRNFSKCVDQVVNNLSSQYGCSIYIL